MKKRTVDILDRARDMELKLNWQLFKFEQDSRIWQNGTDGWKPGDPIHVNPEEMAQLYFQENPEEEEAPFQYTRPMIEMHHQTDALLNWLYDFMDEDVDLFWGCRNCDVLWLDPTSGDQKCWTCNGTSTKATVMYRLQYPVEEMSVIYDEAQNEEKEETDEPADC